MLQLSVFLLLLLLICAFKSVKKPRNFPKGPKWLPVLGSALALKRARTITGMLVKGVRKIAEESQIADLIGFKVGKDFVVFVFSTRALLEMYNNPDLDGRPNGPFYETRTWNQRLGIVLTDGDFWSTQRRFIMRHLKNFGFGHSQMKQICESEMTHCVSDMRWIVDCAGSKNVLVKLKDHFKVYISNTIWQMLARKRYQFDDPDMLKLQSILSELFESIDMMGTTFSHFPLLRYIAPKMSGYQFFVDAHKNFHDFISIEVERHRAAFNSSNEPENLIEVYLKTIHMKTIDEKVHDSFTDKQLRAVILDLFVAGSETTNKSTNFMFFHLVKDISVQDKAREEIDRVVGRNRLPTLDDRVNLPYCNAIVHEAIRVFMTYTCGIPRRALRDTKLCGYDIPKDTIVNSMLNGMMTDERMFPNADYFDPGHFLKDDDFSMPENFHAFGLGRHRCFGEVLAKANSFLILTTVVQNFILEVPDHYTMPAHGEYVDGATADVSDFFVLVREREVNEQQKTCSIR